MHVEVSRIKSKMDTGGFPLLVQNITLSGLRGFLDTRIEFPFPVCAIVGENGAGKTTILKALACIYEAKENRLSFNPGKFFARTPWDIVKNAKINANIKHGVNANIKHGDSDRSVSIVKPTERWRGLDKRAERDVWLFDISRTMPVDALVGYAQITKRRVVEAGAEDLPVEYRQRLSEVMGREYSSAKFAKTDIDEEKRIGVLGREFGQFSQFHQGSGESLSLDLMSAFARIPPSSLVLIDEIEASLHPKAQRRLIHCLLTLARSKAWQVILTTHSPFVLEELPPEARILIVRGKQGVSVIYGASEEFCLSSIDEKRHNRLNIIVEDQEAKELVRQIMYRYDQELASQIGVYPVGGAGVVLTMARLAAQGNLPFRIAAVVDADQNSTEAIMLPGASAPERQIFSDLRQQGWPDLHSRLGVGAGSLHAILDEAMTLNDHHRWCEFVGDKILKSKHVVWDALTSV